VGKMEEGLLSLKWNNHKTTFFENLKIQREKSKYTDATLAVEGKFYPVHKLVMSTCSEYFCNIFERTTCKSPVIVLKDVRSHDLEALLDYMYLGEVNVNQNDLASLVKTAECLKIKGLAVPDEDPTIFRKSSTSSHDDARWESPPPKRRRHDSNTIRPHAVSPVSSSQKSATALVKPAQTAFISPPTSNTVINEQDEPLVVKVEIDNEEQENSFKRENNYKGGISSDCGPFGNYGSENSMKEQEPENFGNTSFYRPSLQQFKQSTFNNSNIDQDEQSGLKAKLDDTEVQGRFRREYIYEGGPSSDHDPFGEYGCGPPLQQNVLKSQQFLNQWLASLNDKGKNVASLSLARYNEILLQLKSARAKTCQKNQQYYNLIKRFDMVTIGGIDKLIKKRKPEN
ncbi:unnamed protein product, partial [Meganyctiphanes norvegica]